jgi:hypothetical protein
MPDRHGPMKALYENRGTSGSSWGTFEETTPNDVLDRITRGILQTDPEWLADVLTAGEITAVEEAFGVSIGEPGDGGEIDPADPAERFSWSVFEADIFAAEGEMATVWFKATVTDADGDDDLTKIKISVGDEGENSKTIVYPEEGSDGQSEISNFELGPLEASAPVTATLSAADTDADGEFVDLVTQEFAGEVPQ